MSAAGYLVAVVTGLYVGAAVLYCIVGKYGLAVTFGAYSLANIGLLLAEKGI